MNSPVFMTVEASDIFFDQRQIRRGLLQSRPTESTDQVTRYLRSHVSYLSQSFDIIYSKNRSMLPVHYHPQGPFIAIFTCLMRTHLHYVSPITSFPGLILKSSG